MKYKILLSLLVVSVLACSVAAAEDELPKVLKNLPEGWQSGTPFDMDAVEGAFTKLKGKQQVKKVLGRRPDLIKGRNKWYFRGKFVDELTDSSWKEFYISFGGKNEEGIYTKVMAAYFKKGELVIYP